MAAFLKNLQNPRIQTRLIAYYAVFAVSTVVLVTYLTYTQAVASLYLAVEDKLNTIASLKEENLTGWMDDKQNFAIFLSSLPDIRALSGMMLNPASPRPDQVSAQKELTTLVTLIAQRTIDYKDIQILDLEGNVKVSVSPKNIGVSQADQSYFIEGQKRTFIQNFYQSDIFDSATLTIATPLFDVGNKRVGVLALHFNLKQMDVIIRGDQGLNQDVQSYLVDHEGSFITDDPIISALVPESVAFEKALNGEEGGATYINHNGVSVIGKYQWLDKQDAALVVEIDEEIALLQPARRLAVKVAAIGIAFSVVLIIIVVLMAQQITGPLRALTQTVMNISDGDLNASAPILSNDEVGTLAQTFNTMTAKLRRSMDGMEKELHDRKQAEIALRVSEERYRTLVEGMRDGIYRSTHDGRFVDVNDSMIRIFGFDSRDEMLAVDIKKDLYFSTEDRNSLFLDTGQEKVEVFRMRRKDGLEIWVEDHGHYVHDAQGNVIYHEGLLRDITDRVHAEKALRESDERFRMVFSTSPIAICITSLSDGRMLDANYAYWDLTALDPETSIGKTQVELKLWDSVEERAVFVKKLREKKSYTDLDNHFVNQRGELKTTLAFYEITQVNGQECILSMFHDMSEQRSTMRALQQSEARVRALLEAIPDMILEVKTDGMIINMIPAKGMEAITPADQFVGKAIGEILPETAVSEALFSIHHVMDSSQINIFEFGLTVREIPRTFESRVVSSSPDTALMMIRDITQRKWIENEREELISELELKNKESETLRESLARIVTTFKFEEAAERVLDQIKRVIPYDTASVWRVEGEWQILLIARDLPKEIKPEDLRFLINEDNSSRPILLGLQPYVLSNNVQEELPDFKEPHSYIHSWLAVPLKVRGKIIGLIALDGVQKDQFAEHHADLAVTFADQLAIALENANLFSDLQSELAKRRNLIAELEAKNAEAETLRESTSIVAATLEFPETVQRILEQIKRVVEYDSASVWLYRDDKAYMVGRNNLPLVDGFLTQFDLSESEPDHPFWKDHVSYILFDDIQEQYPHFKTQPRNYIHGWLAVPLRMRGKLTGFISLDSGRIGKFTRHDAEVALTFAEQVAIALGNSSLFSELQLELSYRKELIAELEKKNVEAETLHESLSAIVVGTFDFSQIVDYVLDQIHRIIPYDSASVWRVEENQQKFVGGRNLPGDIVGLDFTFILNEENYAWPVINGDVAYVLSNDVQAELPNFRQHPHNYISSWLCVPLKVRGKTTGLITIDGRNVHQFNDHHVDLALTFSNQVAIALENADLVLSLQSELDERTKLIEELKRKNAEAETLRESTSIVAATLETPETIEQILEQIKRVVEYDSVSVWSYQDGFAYLMGSNNLPEESVVARYKVDEDQPDYAFWKSDVPFILYDDIQESFPVFQTHPQNYIHGWLAVPLRARGKLMGLISLDSREPGKFTLHDADMAKTFAEQVSIAVENAHLFSDLQTELANRKKLISELEAKNAELERFTYTVSHDLKSPLFTIRGFLGYLEQDAVSGNFERMKSDMQRISDATNKMHQLLNDLLELSRIGRLMNDPAPIPFEDLVNEAVALVQGRIMERGVAVHVDAGMSCVYGDRPRLLEVLQNLVDNAAKFMGDQAEPRIEIGQDGYEDKNPVFYVRDNGIGIPTEHFDRVFGLFNKLDANADGTGIGLTLVKRIVEVHGGRIWVQSEAGVGTTFYFTLNPCPNDE